MSRTVIVLAAGEGKRMKSALPKMLHPLLGRSLVGHVLAAAAPLAAARVIAVVGNRADQVTAHLTEIAPAVETVLQEQQNGTGHAVRIALPGDADGTVIVLNGDVPLLGAATLQALVDAHEKAGAAATVLAAEVANPTGLGRIVRGTDGLLQHIVEERDATQEQRAIREINAGIYAFDAALLRGALGSLNAHNDQGEEYLTDVFGALVAQGRAVGVHVADDADETLGCNDRAELAHLRSLLRDRINTRLMRDGVTINDPATTWIDVTVNVGRDAVIEPNTQLKGATEVGEGSVIGPDVTLIDTVVGEGAKVVRAHAELAEIGDGANVGPFAYLRPGTTLGRKSKVGTFVELKNSSLGEGTKVPHLSYLGDTTVGEQSNIGAGNLTANYNGTTKSRTTIGSHVKTSCDTTFVAPVTIGDGAYTAAGSVIDKDVPAGALAVARAHQRNIEGWVARARAGTAAAEAAKNAAKEAE
ncbi:bifunctional UDP-N-acetylglucosamine diphosphorylase/glucosamine-1-phosphate N-acetyltransferase GlmU [Catelliglobosispora koreensis]|uniref:bifunctional UDP-N-acetylglucosamine diphosphorylase/glucosamine-1-phosphate N-acetyltransferase GlmU n=1 Tax=Catelliglobosispora koreensis TaxID=129052 RepID=UPI0003A306A2|nr:bifunctional UDP-N-acetylglucosamine diphosphorylase/glucosamine-1-phosphate N-acetyltransferase GlmU [Catelliglobosispora koreensis]